MPVKHMQFSVHMHEDRRAVDIGDEIGNPQAWAHVVQLMAYAARHTKDGFVGDMTDGVLLRVSGDPLWFARDFSDVRPITAEHWRNALEVTGWVVDGFLVDVRKAADIEGLLRERARVRQARRRSGDPLTQ